MMEQHPQSTQSGGGTLKVYELAKELGLDSISLLDKLSGLNIKVKSHMSDLGPEEVKTVRSSLGKKEAAPAKKTAVKARKKAAAPAAAETPAGATTTAPAATAASKEKAAAGASVIRRRVKADGGTETVSPPR